MRSGYRSSAVISRAVWIYVFLGFALLCSGYAFQIPEFNSESKSEEKEKNKQSAAEKPAGEYAVPDGFILIKAEKNYSDLSDMTNDSVTTEAKKLEAPGRTQGEDYSVFFRKILEYLKMMFKKLESVF